MKTIIIIIPIEEGLDPIDFVELHSGITYENQADFIARTAIDQRVSSYKLYEISDFMDVFNDEGISSDLNWFGFAYFKKFQPDSVLNEV